MNNERNETPRKGSPQNDRGIPRRVLQKPRLGDILLAARTKADLSIREVAERAGLSKGAVSNMEVGKSQRPNLDTLLALSELYGIDPMTLIEAAGYKLKKPALPDFKPYLRQKYRHLPKDAKAEIADAFQCITEKYGISQQTGPASGEDEDDHQTPTEHDSGGRNSDH